MALLINLPTIEWLNLEHYIDKRRAILITSESVKRDFIHHLGGLNIIKVICVNSSDKVFIDSLEKEKVPADVIYSFGGGRVSDVARLIAHRWGLNIICIPTIISSDALFVDCTGIRENGCVKYIPSTTASKVILDWEILSGVSLKYHLSGCGDVLSIYTGLYDWEHANLQGINLKDEIFSPSIAKIAKGILSGLLAEEDEIKKGSVRGISAIIDCLIMEVVLCKIYGNSRPEEGGEHFFTYCVENKIPHFLHGEMVCFGVLITAYLQGQDWRMIQSFLDRINLNYKPAGLTRKVVIETLKELPFYVVSNNLRHTVYNNFNYEHNKSSIDKFLNEVGLD